MTTSTLQRLYPVSVTTNASAAGYPATNAIDTNPQTLWTASTTPTGANNNAWITIDLGTSQLIDRVRWHSGMATPYPSYSPADYTIAVSQDGLNWTTVVTRTNASAIMNGNEPVGMNGRYVKLTTTKVNDGTGWSLSFYEFWAEKLAVPPSRLYSWANGVYAPGYEIWNVNDGRYDTRWVASLTPAQANNIASVTLTFMQSVPISRLKWVAATGTPYPANAPRNFVIQSSDDGVNWSTVVSRSAPNYTGIVLGSEAINVSAQFLRLVTSTVYDGTGWSLGFLEFWAEGW